MTSLTYEPAKHHHNGGKCSQKHCSFVTCRFRRGVLTELRRDEDVFPLQAVLGQQGLEGHADVLLVSVDHSRICVSRGMGWETNATSWIFNHNISERWNSEFNYSMSLRLFARSSGTHRCVDIQLLEHDPAHCRLCLRLVSEKFPLRGCKQMKKLSKVALNSADCGELQLTSNKRNLVSWVKQEACVHSGFKHQKRTENKRMLAFGETKMKSTGFSLNARSDFTELTGRALGGKCWHVHRSFALARNCRFLRNGFCELDNNLNFWILNVYVQLACMNRRRLQIIVHERASDIICQLFVCSHATVAQFGIYVT